MPTLTLYTTCPIDELFDSLADAAKKEGFAIDEESKKMMVVRKGSLTLSILCGVFVRYARAVCKVKQVEDDEVCLTLYWTNTWWQGVFGPGRTRTAINGLVDRLEDLIERNEFEVLSRKES